MCLETEFTRVFTFGLKHIFPEKYFLTGALLLEEIITYCEMEGVDAVIDSIKGRISESQHQKDNGVPGWWRVSWIILTPT